MWPLLLRPPDFLIEVTSDFSGSALVISEKSEAEARRRPALVVPAAALRREGDLTGVIVRTASADELRWVRIGHVRGDVAEVTSGLRAGDTIVVPTPSRSTATPAPRS